MEIVEVDFITGGLNQEEKMEVLRTLKNGKSEEKPDEKTKNMKPEEENNEIFKYIPVTTDLYNYYIINIKNEIKNKIKDVLIYEKDGRFFDFYRKIEFTKKGNIYTDKYNNIIAYPKIFKTHSELIDSGILSENGFYVIKKSKNNRGNSNAIRKEIVEHIKFNSSNNIKNIINNIIHNDIDKMYDKNISVQHSLIQYEYAENKPDDKISVCICKNDECNKRCDEIRKAYRRDIHNILF